MALFIVLVAWVPVIGLAITGWGLWTESGSTALTGALTLASGVGLLFFCLGVLRWISPQGHSESENTLFRGDADN